LLVRVRVHPLGRVDRATAIPRRGRRCRLALPRHHADDASSQPDARFVEADVRTAFGGCLRQLSEHH
jgi:hypothetical protein